MTIQPRAELLFDPHDLSEKARLQVIESTQDTSVRGSLSRALFAQHVFVITEARRRVAESAQVTPELMVAVMDYVWQAFTPKFVRISGPQIALVYGRALQAAHAGEVDSRYIESLAAEHARRLSSYFHETSRDAVMEAFNTYVNRKVPLRAAAEKALSGYGLTSRQIRGYAANTALETKVNSSVFRRAEAKAMDYVSKSLLSRVTKFAAQEDHNLDQQAEQIAWMWMVEHGRLPENAEKIWLTARDEMTCKVCAPMHGKVVKITEQFELPNKIRLWVPGVHPNCRCKARFRVPRQMVIAKADFDPREHPRGGDPENRGRFSAANRRGPRFKEPDDLARDEVQRILSPVEEEPVISLRGKTEDTEEKISLRPVRTERKISLRPEPTISLRGSTSTTEPTVSLTRSSPEVSLRDAAQDISLRRELEPVVVQMANKIRREAKQPKILYMGVVDFKDDKGNALPVYRVIHPQIEIDGDGSVLFSHDEQWTSDPLEASALAMGWRRDEIKAARMRLEAEPTADYTYSIDDPIMPGTEAYIQLSPDQIDDLVGWAAAQNIPAERERRKDEHMEVNIYAPLDEEDQTQEYWATESMPMRELMKTFKLNPSDFQMDVAVITRGHQSELGSTIFDLGSKHGEEDISVSGDFEVTSTHKGSTIWGSEKAPGITFYHFEPAGTEMEVFGEQESDE